MMTSTATITNGTIPFPMKFRTSAKNKNIKGKVATFALVKEVQEPHNIKEFSFDDMF